jgi:cell division protein FtsQ
VTPGAVRRWRLVRAGRDAVPASVRRFTQRARQRRLRAARSWLIALAGLVLIGSMGAVASATPLLGVSRIEVRGAHLVSPDEVRAAAAVRTGTPLSRVDVDEIGRRVARLAPVARAVVTRSWPNALVVRVDERTGVAAVPAGNQFLIIDGTGVVFNTTATRPAGLPLVLVTAPAPGEPTTRAALTVLAALTPQLRELLVTLVAEATTRIRLELAGGRQIVWGDATENEDKARVATSLLARPGKVIDVSAPDVVTVR